MISSYVPVVTIFMRLSKTANLSKAFDLLVRTAKQLAFSLNGELRDKDHNPLTLQTIDRYRNRIELFSKI